MSAYHQLLWQFCGIYHHNYVFIYLLKTCSISVRFCTKNEIKKYCMYHNVYMLVVVLIILSWNWSYTFSRFGQRVWFGRKTSYFDNISIVYSKAFLCKKNIAVVSDFVFSSEVDVLSPQIEKKQAIRSPDLLFIFTCGCSIIYIYIYTLVQTQLLNQLLKLLSLLLVTKTSFYKNSYLYKTMTTIVGKWVGRKSVLEKFAETNSRRIL